MEMLRVAFLLLGAIVCGCHGLSCYECVDCKEGDMGSMKQCLIPGNDDVCAKIEVQGKVMRTCANDALCDSAIERTANQAWNTIRNAFSDVSKATSHAYCCNSDYCNGAFTKSPSAILLLLPCLIAKIISMY